MILVRWPNYTLLLSCGVCLVEEYTVEKSCIKMKYSASWVFFPVKLQLLFSGYKFVAFFWNLMVFEHISKIL